MFKATKKYIIMLQLIILLATAATVFAECVTRLRSDGIGNIIGHRLFSNGSLGVVDDYARFMIFNSAGVLFYKENLNLPNDPQRVAAPFRVSFAIITSSTNQVYLLSTNDKSFAYTAGTCVTTSYGGYVTLMYFGAFVNLPDFGVVMGNYGPLLYMIDTSKLLFKQNLYPTYGSGYMLNSSYLGRVSANPLLGEYYITTLSNRTFIGAVDQPSFSFIPGTSTAASYVIIEPSFMLITSTIGANSQYLAFAGFYPISAGDKNDHYLRVKQRSPTVSVSLLITNYYIWSVALDNSTATKMYFLTHDGSLYSTTFSTSSINTPTLLIQSLFIKYASLEILTATKLLLRTVDSMAILDIPSLTFSHVVDIKPTGGRHFGSKMFVLTHYFNVSLYELSGDLPVRDNSFTYTGKVKELIVNTVNNRFYILTPTALYTYSLVTYAQIASRTIAQIQAFTSATSLISLNDLTTLMLQPTKIMMIAYGVFGGNFDTVMVSLNDIDLTYVAHSWSTLKDNFLTINAVDSLSGYENITIIRQESMSTFQYTASNTFVNPNYIQYTSYIAPSNRPEIANMKDVLFLSLPWGDKQPVRTDMQSGYWFEGQVESNRFVYGKKAPSDNIRWNWVGFCMPPDMLVQRSNGIFNKTIIFSGPMYLFVAYPSMTAYHSLLSEDFTGGVGYQKSDDNFIFLRGEYEISKIDPLQCYADPTKGYQSFSNPCYVSSCKYCSALDPNKCLVCNSGKVLKSDYSACLTTCNPAYALNGKCYADCPIEYYKYNAPYWTCDTPAICTGSSHGSKLILGDRCNSVSLCPTGSTVNSSKYCTYTSTSASDLTSTSIVANPCATGQIYFQHYSLCVSTSNPFYANYTVSGTTMYCDGSTHFYDIVSKRCLNTCGFYSGIHPQMGLICTTAATCISMGMFTDDTTSGVKLCTSTCSATLWTNLVTKACVSACPNPSTYSQISDRTCITSCGATVFTLESNKSCLISSECLTSSLFMTPTAMTCTSSCGATLYLNSPSSECLTSSACIALPSLLSTVDMKCVTACSASQYLLVGLNQCLTATQCKAVSSASGGGMLSEDDKKCVASCQSNQYLLASQSQCLGAALCKAVPSASGGGLLSEADKKCVSTCSSTTQYLLTSTSQCLTEAACLATSGFGLLSMNDRTCVSTCGSSPRQYIATSTSKCWLSIECVNPLLGNGFTNDGAFTCDSSCPMALYTLATERSCLTATACKAKTIAQGGSLLSQSDMMCVSACSPTQYLLSAASQCLTPALCQAAFSNAGLTDETAMTCVSACSGSQYMMAATHQCLSGTQCMAAFSNSGRLSEDDHLCVSACNSSQYLLQPSKQCLSATACKAKTIAQGGSLLSQSDMMCVSACSPSQYLLTATFQCLTPALCQAAFSNTGLTDETAMTCVSACSGSQYKMPATRQCLSDTQCMGAYSGTGLLSEANRQCVNGCGTSQYLLSSSKQCLTATACKSKTTAEGGSLLSEDNMLCVSGCSPSQYYQASTFQCFSAALCKSSFGNTGHTDETSMTCVSSCTSSQYELIATKQCLNSSQCLAAFGGTGITNDGSHQCVSTCDSSHYLLTSTMNCLTATECKAKTIAEGGSLLSEDDLLCVSACSPSQYLLTATSQCLTPALCQAAFSNTGLTDETAMTCVSACSGSQYKMPATRQCLSDTQCMGAYSGTGLLSEANRQCVSGCGSSQYLLVTTKQCLNVLECTSRFSGTGLLSLQDMKCVSACSVTQYLEQSSSSCLSDIQCKARNMGTGLMNTRDKTCVLNCPSDLFYLASTQQCLTDTDCYLYSANTGLISSSDKKCITACQTSQYLLDGTRQCLTPSECRAHSSNTGLLSEFDKKCTLACQPNQYLLQSTQQCLIASECLASSPSGGYLSDSDKRCQSACSVTQYLISSSSKCVDETACWAQNYLVAPTSRLCEPSCLASEYMDTLSQFCYTKAECSGLAMLTKTSSPNNLCISTCSALEYKDGDEISCLTKQQCTVANGKFVITSNMTCVSSCPSDIHFVVDAECVASCPANYFLEESLPECVQICMESISSVIPTYCLRYLDFRIESAEQREKDSVVVILEVYFESNSTSTVTSFSVELATLFKQVGIVTDTSSNTAGVIAKAINVKQNGNRIELEFTTDVELQDSFSVKITPETDVEFVSNKYRSSFRGTPKTAKISILSMSSINPTSYTVAPGAVTDLGKVISQTIVATKILTPLLMSTFLSVSTGSLLCLISQTFTKLMMLTHLNFKLDYNAYSVMYYSVFKELLDTSNESMMKGIVGEDTVEKNKQYVCDEGFDKLCFLTVEDNFFMSHLLTLVILAGQALFIVALSQILRQLKFKSASDLLISRLKNFLIYAFLLENSIQFWFTLLLNALISVYRIAILSVMKVGGHVVMAIMLAFLINMLMRRNFKVTDLPISLQQGSDIKLPPIQAIFETVFRNFRSIVKGFTTDQTATVFLKVYLIHDFIFAMLFVPGKYLGDYQMPVWLVVEVALVALLGKYRPFSTRLLNLRQIVIESLMVVILFITTLVPHLKSSNRTLSALILIFSSIPMGIDLCFTIAEYVKITISLVKYVARMKRSNFKAVKPNTMASDRAPEALKNAAKGDYEVDDPLLLTRRISLMSGMDKSSRVLQQLTQKNSVSPSKNPLILSSTSKNSIQNTRMFKSPKFSSPVVGMGVNAGSPDILPAKNTSNRLISTLQSSTRNMNGGIIENKMATDNTSLTQLQSPPCLFKPSFKKFTTLK